MNKFELEVITNNEPVSSLSIISSNAVFNTCSV